MKAKQLIELLQQKDPESEVVFISYSSSTTELVVIEEVADLFVGSATLTTGNVEQPLHDRTIKVIELF